jgi:hypothetical protein
MLKTNLHFRMLEEAIKQGKNILFVENNERMFDIEYAKRLFSNNTDESKNDFLKFKGKTNVL